MEYGLVLPKSSAHSLQVMGEKRIRGWLAAGGFAVTAVVTVACALFLWQTFAL